MKRSGGPSPGSSELLEVRRDKSSVWLTGELDIATCPRLVAELHAAIEEGETDLIVDCADVTFFGAAGVSALVCARQRLDASGRSLKIRKPSRSVRRVLEIVNLDEMMVPERPDAPAV